jgi:hypothetical protein
VRRATKINHGSAHALDPRRAAEHLAALTGGLARPFHPCEGAWVCFLRGEDEDWDGQLIEFYPQDINLATEKGRLVFRKTKIPRNPNRGTHFNVSVPKTRKELENLCAERELVCSWRDWQGLLEVWIDDLLLLEFVPESP